MDYGLLTKDYGYGLWTIDMDYGLWDMECDIHVKYGIWNALYNGMEWNGWN